MRAVIMAGGWGIRLLPYTKVLPKPLLPLNDTPILEIILRQLKEAGFTQVTIALNYKADTIRNYVTARTNFGMNITFTHEKESLGTIGALRLVQDLCNEEPMLVMNADVLTDFDFRAFYHFHQENRSMLSVMLSKKKVHVDFGVVELTDDNRIVGITEKPDFDYFVSSGVYMMNTSVINYIYERSMGVPDLIKNLISDGHKVHSYLHEGVWMDIGTGDSLIEASRFFLENRQLFLKDEITINSI